MKRLLLLSLISCALVHAEGPSRKLYRWSVAALVAGNSADVASSWGAQEIGPAYMHGRFGYGNAALKVGFVASGLTFQHFYLKHHPEARRSMTISNFAVGGAMGALAFRNFEVRAK